jgi:general secretion pathway protein C
MPRQLATLVFIWSVMTLYSIGVPARAETASTPSRDQPSQSPVPLAINSDVQLLGTISGDRVKPGSRSVALIKHKASGRIAAVPLGGNAFDSGQISDIQNKTIVITDSSGSKTMVTSKLGGAWAAGYVPPPPASVPISGDRYSELGFERVGNHTRIDAAYRDRMVSKELPTILMSAASEPVVENGTIQGFRLFQFEPGSVFEKLGMEDGDIVSSINGVPLNDVARTIQFLNGLKAEKQVEVSIIRNGKPVTLSLDVN